MTFIGFFPNGAFDSLLEPPASNSPNATGTLTITIRYSLRFADEHTVAPALRLNDGLPAVRDTLGKLFPIDNWTAASRAAFRKTFQRGQNIWDARFRLITPYTFPDFDFTPAGHNYRLRPDILCRLRLEPSSDYHHLITVCRLERNGYEDQFRGNEDLFADFDVRTPVLGHEIGHMLGQRNIGLLLRRDPFCMLAPKSDRCFGETEAERANIMGTGSDLWPLNAKSWLERIELHTTTPIDQWSVKMT